MSFANLVQEHPERPVSPLLAFGVFICPVLFVWFLLRDGHTNRSRLIGFAWLAICLIGWKMIAQGVVLLIAVSVVAFFMSVFDQ